MTCRCDEHPCASPVAIAAGLACLPRAPGQFADWRLRVLDAVGREGALDEWRARERGDLGLMLVEMGAYVLDVASFYDQLVANESYLGTASLPGAQRQLTSLLGYRPRPATGASVWLAAEADGTRVLTLPAGTAVRSGEFSGNPPQVFELSADAQVEPRVNRLEVQRVRASLIASPLSQVQVRTPSLRVQRGSRVVFDCNGTLAAVRVASTAVLALRSRDAVSSITFEAAVTLPDTATYADTRLLTGGATSAAWKLTPGSGESAVLSGAELSLDSRVALRPGEVVIVTDGTTDAPRRITAVTEVLYTVQASLSSTITDSDGHTSTLASPPLKVSVTRLTFDSTLPFASAASLVVHHTMVQAAALHAPLKDTLAQGDAMALPGLIDAPRTQVTQIALQDVHGEGVVTTGALDAASRSASGDSSPAWGQELWAPVQLMGNVMLATRGESVQGEVLGQGDASQALQTFRLKKKPLTYLAASNAAGRKSTLAVRVGGVLWQEVESFFGASDHHTIYTVQHDDEGHTDVCFGGGARLPTGALVVADYRFGGGAAVPPADSVKQLARPVPGLRKVRNVLPAFGGGDAEAASEVAVRGPRSALLLGRAISLMDMETAASLQLGVRAARAAWRWDACGLRPAVVVSFIGDAQLAPSLLASLRNLAEDDAPISVVSAPAQPARLDVDVQTDGLRDPKDVVADVIQTLFAPVVLPGSGGLLRAERLGPDGVVFQSAVVRAVMEVPGVQALRSLSFDGTPFTDTGREPEDGCWFDFAAGGVWVNGQRAS